MSFSLRYVLVDVFTDRPLTGNPLAIVEGAEGLPTATMQAIAREFNLSETVFLLEPRDPVNTARARIFTPTRELPFAGHPTVGAAAHIAETRAKDVLGRSDVVVALEEEIGVLRCEAMRARSGVIFAQFALPALPRKLGAPPPRAAIADALSLAPEEIGFDAQESAHESAHEPAIWSAGVPFLFVPLRSDTVLAKARRAARFSAVLGAAAGAYLYCRETRHPESAAQARMFANGLGMDEDPATGSAAAAFAGVAHEFERPGDGEHEIFIEQGYAIGRPSRITLVMSVEAGKLVSVRVGGQIVRVGEGMLRL